MDPADPLGQRRVLDRTAALTVGLPGVVARARHTKHAAQPGDRVVGRLRVDQRQRLAHRRSVSRAKKATAFFKMSRSSSTMRTRRRRRRSSSCSAVVSPSASLASTAACLRYNRNVSPLTPSSAATSFHRSPRCNDSRTASARNSGGYGLRKFGTTTPFLASTPANR